MSQENAKQFPGLLPGEGAFGYCVKRPITVNQKFALRLVGLGLDTVLYNAYNRYILSIEESYAMAKMVVHAVKCSQCGRTFTALHEKATYCSDACRSAAYRQRARHTDKEPIRGLSGHAAIMYSDLANCSEGASLLLQKLRDKRGLTAAREALFIAMAAIWPGVMDPTTAYHEFFVNELPQYMKEG